MLCILKSNQSWCWVFVLFSMHYEEWLLVLYHHSTKQKVLYHQLSLASCNISAGYTVKSQVWKATGSCKCCRLFLRPIQLFTMGSKKTSVSKLNGKTLQAIADYIKSGQGKLFIIKLGMEGKLTRRASKEDHCYEWSRHFDSCWYS